VQIAFGTGRQLTAADRTSTAAHNLYGVRDNFTINRSNNTVSLSGTTRVTSLSQLVKQGASANVQFSTTTRNAVDYGNTVSLSGWYMPLPGEGERLLDNPVGVQGKLLEFATNVPSAKPSASCEISYGSGTTYISYLDIINGSAPTVSLLTKVPTDSRYLANRFQASGMRVTSKGIGERRVISIDPANGSSTGGWSIDPQAKLVQVDWRRLN
jgi:type IV pilus assembly protein PilY1